MKVVVRTDSSLLIGTGHMMRCLTLAEELRRNGVEVVFICREHPGNIIERAVLKGFKVHRLPLDDDKLMNDPDRSLYDRWRGVEKEYDAEQTRAVLSVPESDADWLVVDHYGLDAAWEATMRSYVDGIMVIDDLANRRHDCDILLDQNLYERLETRYDGLVPTGAHLLLGPEFVLLRDEFRQARRNLKKRNGRVGRLLISFGGTDTGNDTMKALAMATLPDFRDLTFEIVVGQTNPQAEKIKKVCAGLPRTGYHRNIDNMAQLMAGTDLCVGAGGTSTWERCCLGLPTVTLAVAENQVEVARLSEKAGFARYLGMNHEVDVDDICQAVRELVSNPEKLRKMSTVGMELVDGRGADKVVKNILKFVSVKKQG
ncbi:MAG: UDP-2,4-diacetamido-2,4,6-trideoxy-beta-L-altropyranose hydrolase [Candidatus Zixiibacteriota bacterium]